MRTIAHISDLHFGRIDPPVAEALAQELNRRPPSLLVISGDFTQRARAGQYRQAAEYLKRLPTPRIVVPGNHDVPMYDVVRRFFFPLNRYVQHITADLSPTYQDAEIFVLGVNTARSFTQKSGWIDDGQMAGICERLKMVPAGLTKILVTHHPFIPAPREPRGDILRRAPRTLAHLEQCGVDLTLAGHLHFAYSDDVRSFHTTALHPVLSIQCGTSTSTRRRGEANSYNWITVDGETVTVAVRTWNGRAFEESSVGRYRRVEGIWRRQSPPPA